MDKYQLIEQTLDKRLFTESYFEDKYPGLPYEYYEVLARDANLKHMKNELLREIRTRLPCLNDGFLRGRPLKSDPPSELFDRMSLQ